MYESIAPSSALWKIEDVCALELKVPPVVVGLIAAAAMAMTARLLPAAAWPSTAAQVTGGLIANLGVLIALMGTLAFRRAQTTVNPMNPDASSALVTSGIYARTRNPMYVGFALVLIGWGFVLGNVACLLVVPAFSAYLTRFQIVPEERALAHFGPAFEAYRTSVRRWL